MRRRGLGTVLVALGATVLFGYTVPGDHLQGRIFAALSRRAFDVPHGWLGGLSWRIVFELATAVSNVLPAVMAVTSVAAIAAVIARSVSAARLRAGRPDPMDRLRARPRLVRALALLPALAFALPVAVFSVAFFGQLHDGTLGWWLEAWISTLVTGGVLTALAYAAGRAGMRAVLAPTLANESAPRDPRDIVFSAVAITTRTRAAVAALAAATVAMVGWTLVAPSNVAFPWALAAYIAAAMSAPFALRRASRIAVGLDGVWVRDASRALFFAYRDLEGARARGADLELVARGGGTALRLQMHGDDASRRDEVLARIEDAIARSRTGDTRGPATLVQAMPTRHIVASAGGDARYRMPSISREQLWDLVESPASDASTRTAAAEALAIEIDDADRARLRVAAGQCAEPRVRVALAALADDEAAEEEASPPREQREAGQPSHRLG